MVVWFCARLHDDHKPNTPFSDFPEPYGVANPCGDMGIGSVDTKSVIPLRNSTTQG
jgi:hypothetical protein